MIECKRRNAFFEVVPAIHTVVFAAGQAFLILFCSDWVDTTPHCQAGAGSGTFCSQIDPLHGVQWVWCTMCTIQESDFESLRLYTGFIFVQTLQQVFATPCLCFAMFCDILQLCCSCIMMFCDSTWCHGFYVQLMRWAPFKVRCAAATATATTAAGAEHGGKSESRAGCLWVNWQQVPSFSCCTYWFLPLLFDCIVQTYVPPKGPVRFQAPVKP